MNTASDTHAHTHTEKRTILAIKQHKIVNAHAKHGLKQKSKQQDITNY